MRTYGKVHRNTDHWVIETEAQVAIRAKRVFPKIYAKATALRLVDTIENCRELLWFLERYPMDVAAVDLMYMARRSKAHEEYLDKIGSLITYVPSAPLAMALKLRDYQRQATELAWHVGGLLIGDDVGLGKTAEAIAVLSNPDCLPAMVVTLTHLPRQWTEEFGKFLPGLSTHTLKQGTPYKKEWKQPDVIICNYHKLSGWAGELTGKIKTIIFDECHELRHSDSAKYRGAQLIASQAMHRIGLSATPIFNYGSEIWNILEILRPGCLGNREEFSQEWCNGGLHSVDKPRAFGSYLRENGLMIRRTRKDVARELPPITIVPQNIDIDDEALTKVATSVEELAKFVMSNNGSGIEKLKAAGELDWKLREATGVAKAPFAAEFIRLLVEQGEKVLVGAWHHAVYDVLMKKLHDLNPVRFTGEESAKQKQDAKDAFMGDSPVMFMSLRAGAGLDGLQKVCSVVVYVELDWSPAVHEQFTGRVARDGQENPTVVYYLIAESGSDPVIADTLGVKRAQLEGIRNLVDTQQQTDPDRVRKMAAEYLRQRGVGAKVAKE